MVANQDALIYDDKGVVRVKVTGDNDDQNMGIQIARARCPRLASDCAERQLEGNAGYDGATVEYGDMIELSTPDPAKLTHTALQAAASVGGLMITTEAMVAELPEDNPRLNTGSTDANDHRGR